MGMYRDRTFSSHTITKAMYDFTIMFYGNCHALFHFYEGNNCRPFIVERNGDYLFFGTDIDWEEMLDRCLYLEDSEKTEEAINYHRIKNTLL